VTPSFAFEGKRTVLSDDYYQSLTRPNVMLIPHAAQALTSAGLVDAAGDEHELDVIVLATGFDAANYLAGFVVTGRDGIELHAQWSGEPQALLGLMTPNFPNFFMLYGPNTNSVPLVSFYEAQARFAAKAIAKLGRSGQSEVDVSAPLTDRYNTWLQDRLRRTAWNATSNYYQARTGRIVTQWPFSASAYIAATRLARHFALSYRSPRSAWPAQNLPRSLRVEPAIHPLTGNLRQAAARAESPSRLGRAAGRRESGGD
jgi:hypothetical protein